MQKLMGVESMNLWKLRLSMFGTLTLIIGFSTLAFAAILYFTGALSIMSLLILLVPFNIIQWLLAPYMIDAIYNVKEVKPSENPELCHMVERLSKRSGISAPRVMLARIPIPNAFAYGSPIAGNRVAVTEGLLKELNTGEVEAVLGHEIGHLKHRDMQIMMFASFLPAVFFYLGYWLMLSAGYSRDRREGGAAIIGIVSIALYWILTLLSLSLSRLREYYADQHSVSIVEDGRRKLSVALAKIASSSKRLKARRGDLSGFNSFKALFIADPESAVGEPRFSAFGFTLNEEELVRRIISRKVTAADRFAEIFSTHPNMVKRLRAILGLS